MTKITEHLQEYRQQLEQVERQAAALRGAIQALERLQKEEAESGDEQDSNTE